MKNKKDEAEEMFMKGYACSQSVLSVFAEETELPREKALHIASGFGSGMARQAETCGAVTGAFMVIGLKSGLKEKENQAVEKEAYDAMEYFIEKFKERHGSLLCRELLGADVSTAQGRCKASEQNLYARNCPQYVRSAVEILEKI